MQKDRYRSRHPGSTVPFPLFDFFTRCLDTPPNGKTSKQTHDFIYSHSGMTASQLLKAKRSHWFIENQLHNSVKMKAEPELTIPRRISTSLHPLAVHNSFTHAITLMDTPVQQIGISNDAPGKN